MKTETILSFRNIKLVKTDSETPFVVMHRDNTCSATLACAASEGELDGPYNSYDLLLEELAVVKLWEQDYL